MSVLDRVIREVSNSNEAEDLKKAVQELRVYVDTKAQDMAKKIEQDLSEGKTKDGLTVPIVKIVRKEIEFRATLPFEEISSNYLAQNLTMSISKMFSGNGNVLNAMCSILEKDLEDLLSCSVGDESKMEQYIVVAEYPAIVRYDFAFWECKIAVQGIQKYMKDVLACVAYKSSVDVTRLTFNAFLSYYGPVLEAAYPNDIRQIKPYLQEAKEIYDILLDTERR